MRLIAGALLGLLVTNGAMAASLEKGQRIHKTCALCHGAWGQGTASATSPRIAGLTKGFMVKILGEYRSGKRKNAGMVATSGIHKMTDDDIESVADYLAAIDLQQDPNFEIFAVEGDKAKGEEIFTGECKGCHTSTGYGKPEKGIPPLAGQQPNYIIRAIERFKARDRVHDDDPQDTLFDEMFKSKEDMQNLTAYLATLDDITTPRVAVLPDIRPSGPIGMAGVETPRTTIADATKTEEVPGASVSDIVQTVAKMQLNPGVSREDAINSMRVKAEELNMRVVGEQHVSKALEERGEKSPYLAIFQFCNLGDAKTIITDNPLYAAYMPCRVAMVEDKEGKTWLMMLNLDILVDNMIVSRQIAETVINVNQKMLEIMVAGVNGTL